MSDSFDKDKEELQNSDLNQRERTPLPTSSSISPEELEKLRQSAVEPVSRKATSNSIPPLVRKPRKKNPITIVAWLLLLFTVVVGGYYMVTKYMPNFQQVFFYDYYEQIDSEKMYIVLEGNRLDSANYVLAQNGDLYVSIEFLKEYVDPYIFWEEPSNRVTITTENKVIRMRTEELTYYVNDEVLNLNLPVHNIDGVAYLPSTLLKSLYDITIEYADAYKMVIVDFMDTDKKIMEVTAKTTPMRFEGDLKSPILEKLPLGAKVLFMKDHGDFMKVRTSDGLIGYVLKSDVILFETIPGIPATASKPQSPPFTYSGKLNVVWEQFENSSASASVENRVPIKGLDVLSPTWFSFNEKELNGDIINIGDKAYVDWAHEQGYQVWALITDNFKGDVSHAVLSDSDVREHVIKQLLAFVAMYDLDGINIDFEMIREEDADFFIQFLRELAPYMKTQGAVLSVDMYVPRPWNLYYNRTEVAKVADYIMIMGYDEYYSKSKVSGPNASIGFSEDSIIETLKEVPKEKIILGVPYFVRIWTETLDENPTVIGTRSVGMNYGRRLFQEAGAEFVWDEETGSYYSEYVVNEDGQDVKKRVWLEDERSMTEKLKLVNKYDIAGVAGWKRGLEKEEIWELLHDFLGKK